MIQRSKRWGFLSAVVFFSAALILASCSSTAGQVKTSSPPASGASPGASGNVVPGGNGRGGGEGLEGTEGNEANEGGESGEGGARAAMQRVSVTITDSAVQPTSLTSPAGLIEFDVSNQGQKTHHVSITGGGAQGDTGSIAPGQTVRFQGNLGPGTYKVAVDPDASPQPGPTAVLTVP